MTDQNPKTAVPTSDSKSSFKDRALSRTAPVRKHAKTVFAGIGVVSVAVVVASKLAKDKGVDSVKVDLPNVDVTTDAN